ncbi:MAG: hypothetical protein AB7G28_19585 [Pirellulales bacterium]
MRHHATNRVIGPPVAVGAVLTLGFCYCILGTASAQDWQSANWDLVRSSTGSKYRSAPIRNLIRAPSGNLLGTRPAGGVIELWQSGNNGKDWSRLPNIAVSSTVEYGDSTLLALPSGELLSAYREHHPTLGWSVRISRSVDGGAHWNFAGTIHDWNQEFVGAPQLLQLSNGALQAYYDSEVLASGGSQYIGVKTGSFDAGTSTWNWSQERRVNAQPANGFVVRDGLASVVNLGPDLDGVGDRLMVVTEGVGTRSGQEYNLIRAFQVQNGGATQADWNALLDSRVIYQSPQIDPNNHRYNAYAPYALRVGNGPVMVAFSTDEFLDEVGAPADVASTPPNLRHSEIKFMKTTSTFESWSTPKTMWGMDHPEFTGSANSGDIFNYQIGLIELAPNDVLATLDMFNGRQIVLRPSEFATGDFNQNGMIDAADYTIWQDSLGSTEDLRADANSNSVIDVGDFESWKAGFAAASSSSGGGAAAVPEPASLAMILPALVSGHICRVSRRGSNCTRRSPRPNSTEIILS